MPKVNLIGNSLAYLLCQTRQRTTDYRPGMTPEDVRVVFAKSQHGERDNTKSMARDVGMIPIAHTMAALLHERPVTLTNRRTQMRKVSSIGNSLAYLLCQTRQRTTDYRPGMTPEDVRVVFAKSQRGERDNTKSTVRDIGTIRTGVIVAASR